MRAVIDTNVLLSGLLWRGAPHVLLEHVRAGTLDLVSSPALLAELEAVIIRAKFDAILTREEMQAGIEAYRKQRGRPAGSDKESTTIRFDRDVLAAFHAAGPGWQTRMNAALRDWLKNHSPA